MHGFFPVARRSAIVVELKGPFIEWVYNIRRAHYGERQANLEHIKKLCAQKKNVYLSPRGKFSEPEEYIKRNYPGIFESELREWCLEKRLWPECRSWEMFCEWTGYEFCPTVFDTVPGMDLQCER